MKRVILASGICLGLFAMARLTSENHSAAGNYSYRTNDLIRTDTGSKPKPDTTKRSAAFAYLRDTTKKPKPDSMQTVSLLA